eukprot:CAMPEP_0113492032 /NCGR_PEP_ID=MMETSP0014_2-20120614/27862_1 /TAXON_ID=2857 /ORGANISM="Nitzschia sp." /LENGTH=93 /DNA_ID=CAMNT_0000385841 /DNA_START=200 /DNA_END=481 /DNA_ORIENTATION=- /assembly_acc=CAM_ASM_000159
MTEYRLTVTLVRIYLVRSVSNIPLLLIPFVRSLDTTTNNDTNLPPNRKDAKKVAKLEAQIPYHEGRGNKDEVSKIKEQVEEIWRKTREAVDAI